MSIKKSAGLSDEAQEAIAALVLIAIFVTGMVYFCASA